MWAIIILHDQDPVIDVVTKLEIKLPDLHKRIPSSLEINEHLSLKKSMRTNDPSEIAGMKISLL